jgi:hypothetical protein
MLETIFSILILVILGLILKPLFDRQIKDEREWYALQKQLNKSLIRYFDNIDKKE